MKIAIIGTGYVGLVTGVCLAEIGHKVICYDKDEKKIDLLLENKMPIYEPFVDKLVIKNKEKNRLYFTKDLTEAIKFAKVIFICVGTPPLKNGEADLSAIEDVTQKIAQNLDSYKLIVEKSTVPVQTNLWVEKTLRLYGKKKAEFDIASNPEFLSEGRAVYDFLHPWRIVVGVKTKKAEKILREIYKPIVERKFNCPIHKKGCPLKNKVPFIVTDINSAELIKHASNSFLAMKISYINALADICEKTGANIKDVALGMGLDPRIGKEFLRAGIGFGGFCFPKDLQAFIKMAQKYNYDFKLLKEVEKINQDRIKRVMEKLKSHIWILEGKLIGVLGLAFKPDTDDIRFSPALKIIKNLIKEKVRVKTYDPKAMEKAKRELPQIEFCSDPYQVAKDSECLIICTDWKEFKDLDWKKMKKLMKRPFILDGRNMLDKEYLKDLGFEYVGFGI